MELDRVVRSRLKLVRVKVLDGAFLPAGADRLLARLAAREHLNVHHVVLLLPTLRVEVDARVKDQIARLHLFKLKIDWKRVVLVRLVPAVQLEPEVLPQIVDDLPNESAAIQEERRIVVRVSRVVVPLRVGHSEVLDAPIDELLPELPLELRVPPINCRLLGHVVPILDLLLFGLAETIEVGLEPTGGKPTSKAQ